MVAAKEQEVDQRVGEIIAFQKKTDRLQVLTSPLLVTLFSAQVMRELGDNTVSPDAFVKLVDNLSTHDDVSAVYISRYERDESRDRNNAALGVTVQVAHPSSKTDYSFYKASHEVASLHTLFLQESKDQGFPLDSRINVFPNGYYKTPEQLLVRLDDLQADRNITPIAQAKFIR